MQIDTGKIKEAIYRAENGDALELIEIAKELQSDPLTALAAVMRMHAIDFNVGAEGSGLFEPVFSIEDNVNEDSLFEIDTFATLTADDIKPEK